MERDSGCAKSKEQRQQQKTGLRALMIPLPECRSLYTRGKERSRKCESKREERVGERGERRREEGKGRGREREREREQEGVSHRRRESEVEKARDTASRGATAQRILQNKMVTT